MEKGALWTAPHPQSRPHRSGDLWHRRRARGAETFVGRCHVSRAMLKAANHRSSPKALRAFKIVPFTAKLHLHRVNEDRSIRWQRVRNALRSSIAGQARWEEQIEAIVDAIWMEFGDHRPVSWVGYYHLGSGEMTLGPRRNKPACSPIGLHGACGQAALSGRSLLVHDVRKLGPCYIACDPRDLSELVVPVTTPDGMVLGVLDLDSYSESAFDETDQRALEGIARDFLRGNAISTSPS
jgi:putative methionine-R-sulfoxide reductase with GAF domain